MRILLHKVGAAAAALAMLQMAMVVAGVAQQTVGDCDQDGSVTVDELVVGVNIALGESPVADCPSFDADGDGQVTIDELTLGVNNALNGPASTQAFVIATDFQTGSFATVGLAAPRPVSPVNPMRRVNSDAIARPHGGLVYVVNRFGGDSIQILDPSQDFAIRAQCSTGGGSNPQDIAFASATKAYVTRFGTPLLLIVNPSPQPDCSDFVRGTIDLSALADADGNPEMSQLAIVGDRLYVSLQRLQNFMPAGPGVIAVVDIATDQVVTAITLGGENPFAQTKGLTVVNGALVVAEDGAFGVNDGGLERVDLASGTAQGFFISEADLGGDITDFVLVSDRLGYAIVSKPDFSNVLEAFDPVTRTVIQPVLTSSSLSDVELNDRGELYVADRSITQPGIRIFRASDGVQLTDAPLDLGLPPFDISFLP